MKTDQELAKENDDMVWQETRKRLLELLPDDSLLNQFEQAVINRAVRAVTQEDKS